MLRVFGLHGPVLPIQRLMIDEAQDLNPLMLSIIQRHLDAGVQTVLVGDSAQAIYGWNGSVNAMETMLSQAQWTRLDLSVSFRCPPDVIALANQVLNKADHSLRLSSANVGARQTNGLPKTAAICRTNAGCVDRIASFGLRRQRVYCPKKPDLYLMWQLFFLKTGKLDKVEHPELSRYERWADLGQAVKSGLAPRDMAVAYRMIDQDPGDFSKKLKQIKSVMVDQPTHADVVVLTAHAAKGLEFESVEIGEDFGDALMDADPLQRLEELNILYVAITRAMVGLVKPSQYEMIRHWLKSVR